MICCEREWWEVEKARFGFPELGAGGRGWCTASEPPSSSVAACGTLLLTRSRRRSSGAGALRCGEGNLREGEGVVAGR